MNNIYKREKLMGYLLPFIIIFTSTTGWYSLDYVGMNIFWVIFFISSLSISALIVFSYKEQIGFKYFFKDKFNLIILIYCLWLSFSYLFNYQGKSSLLYVFKVWFLLGIYLIFLKIYFNNTSRECQKDLLGKVTISIFILGMFNSAIGLYQFMTLSNKLLGIVITDWPAFNPAAMYGNVNGFGTYLFISIISGLYYFTNNLDKKHISFILFGMVFQSYMLYLTVARTSIVSLIAFILFSLILFFIKDRSLLKKLFNKKYLIIILISNLIMISIIMMPKYRAWINSFFNSSVSSSERTAQDMLKEKNEKGLNYRDIIWKAVIKDYDEYIIAGDGLKYNIVEKINVVNVISERSKGATRISYHNTLVRYFASNGLMGLIAFLAVYFYVPLVLFLRMLKQRKINVKYSMVIITMASIFMYAQMEEVYIGEIGFMALLTVIVLAYGGSLLRKTEENSLNK